VRHCSGTQFTVRKPRSSPAGSYRPHIAKSGADPSPTAWPRTTKWGTFRGAPRQTTPDSSSYPRRPPPQHVATARGLRRDACLSVRRRFPPHWAWGADVRSPRTQLLDHAPERTRTRSSAFLATSHARPDAERLHFVLSAPPPCPPTAAATHVYCAGPCSERVVSPIVAFLWPFVHLLRLAIVLLRRFSILNPLALLVPFVAPHLLPLGSSSRYGSAAFHWSNFCLSECCLSSRFSFFKNCFFSTRAPRLAIPPLGCGFGGTATAVTN